MASFTQAYPGQLIASAYFNASLNAVEASHLALTGGTLTGNLTLGQNYAAQNNTVALAATNGQYGLRIVPRANATAFNPLTQAGDTVIYFTGASIATGGLVIGPWSTTNGGLRFDSNGNAAFSNPLYVPTVGASDNSNLAASTAYVKSQGYITRQAPSRQVFTASSTFWPPNGVFTVKVIVVGGGGGGAFAWFTGSPNWISGSGGGGGGHCGRICNVTPGAGIAVTIGAGGTCGYAANYNGTTGGTSSFGAYCSASGGIGGHWTTSTSSPGGYGGNGSGGDWNSAGQDGSDGMNSTYIFAGNGGCSLLGGGGRAGTPTGQNGLNYGGGGGGGYGGYGNGGYGAGGIVIVEW